MSLTDIDWSEIPAPEDDGKAAHLQGAALPAVSLPATDGTTVDLGALTGLTVLYIYPRTGRPGVDLPEGWNDIPGARGCTPQSCAFRDHFAQLKALGVDQVFGLSTQATAEQTEAADRLNLPYRLLSDADGDLRRALDLPAFEAEGQTLLKRLTLILRDTAVVDVGYPVFPPDADVLRVIEWLDRED
jgi:peroxiredoxin